MTESEWTKLRRMLDENVVISVGNAQIIYPLLDELKAEFDRLQVDAQKWRKLCSGEQPISGFNLEYQNEKLIQLRTRIWDSSNVMREILAANDDRKAPRLHEYKVEIIGELDKILGVKDVKGITPVQQFLGDTE